MFKISKLEQKIKRYEQQIVYIVRSTFKTNSQLNSNKKASKVNCFESLKANIESSRERRSSVEPKIKTKLEDKAAAIKQNGWISSKKVPVPPK